MDVVIVSWNTLALTRACLQSLFAEVDRAGLAPAVWVVDNASEDGSARMVAAEFPAVRLIVNAENVGFARANNQALRRGTAPLVMLLNSDAVILPGAIDALLRYLENSPSVSAVGPRLVFPDGSAQRSYAALPTVPGEIVFCLTQRFAPFDRLLRRLLEPRRGSSEHTPQVVEVLSAACLVLRRSVLDKVGLLAEDYFLFSEENDLFWRMQRQKLVSHYLPTARVVHVVGASRTHRGELDSQVNFLRSRLIFFGRCRPSSLLIVRLIHGIFLQWSLLLAKLSALLKGRRESDYVTLYRRLWDVVRDRAPMSS